MLRILIVMLYICLDTLADVETTKHKHSISVQIGENGTMQDFSTFAL